MFNQRRWNLQEELSDYMNRRFTLREVYQQILNKECSLPRRVRDYVVSMFDEQGEFKKTNHEKQN